VSTISIQHLLEEALAAEQMESHARELTKLGELRGGNSGLILSTGQPAGACPRIAHLRSIGVDTGGAGADDSQLTMWEGGIVNEHYWADKLGRVWSGTILRESDIPVSWESEGVRVSGRPDLVLCTKDNFPLMGLELKSMSSIWTLEKVSLGVSTAPKLEHLAQAGHYSWQLARKYGMPEPLPYRLIYSAHVNYAGPEWMGKLLPVARYDRTGTVGNHPLIELGKDQKFKNTRPHHVIYELSWDLKYDRGILVDGRLKFRREGADRYIESPVHWSGIEEFYRQAGPAMREKMPERPVTLKGDGRKASFSMCDPRYCTLAEVCDRSEHKGYAQWLRDVRTRSTNTQHKE
jgi:hypothetical protein